MRRHVLNILVSMLIVHAFSGYAYAQELDSLKRQALSDKLQEYFEALVHETLPVQQQECDFLIESATDSLVRQFVAETVFNHFVDSKVMGAENVAVHVFDNWFLNGKVKMKDERDFITAKVFADFNRQSLLGKKAPALVMDNPEGEAVNLFGKEDSGGKFRVLYFYDTSCAKCRLETILLRNLLQVRKYPVELYAVYAGDDHSAWNAYVKESFMPDSSSFKTVHMWDPELDSDFQRLYAVVQTPRMFLVGPDGTILGRGLDTKALEQLLDGIFAAPEELVYGSDEAMRIFDGIFAGRELKGKDVMETADYIAHRTLEKGDTLMFRQLAGDLLYHLSLQRGESFKEGLDYHIDKYILSRPDIWKSPDDSLKVVGFAGIMKDLLSKARPGSRMPGLKVKGERLMHSGRKDGRFSLRCLGGRTNYIIFYTEGCDVCAAEKQAAQDAVLRDRNIRVLMVNMDEIMENDPGLAGELMDSFDLSSLPLIIETDRKGIIRRRYLSLL